MRKLQLVDAMELATAYANAEYAVLLDGDALQLKVGAQATDLEAYWPRQRYAFITAWNPASVPHSEAANDLANDSLLAQLNAAGIAHLPAHSFDLGGKWREPGWVAADIDSLTLDRLAREFGQVGVLDWGFGEPVRLRMMVSRPPSAPANEMILWASSEENGIKPPAIA